MAFALNGTTAVHGATTLGKARSITFRENGEEIDITDLDDTLTRWELGNTSIEATLEVLGEPTIAVGASGDLVISWNSGGSDTVPDALVQSVETGGGGVNEPIVTSYRFVPGDE